MKKEVNNESISRGVLALDTVFLSHSNFNYQTITTFDEAFDFFSPDHPTCSASLNVETMQ